MADAAREGHANDSRTQTELIEAAAALADADERLLYQLIEARRTSGMSQKDVARALGISKAAVAAFERYDSDPHLSMVRRYALAVGAHIAHEVRTAVAV